MTFIISAVGTPIERKGEDLHLDLGPTSHALRKAELLFPSLQSNMHSVCIRGCRTESKTTDHEGVCLVKCQNLRMLEMRRLLRNHLVQPNHCTNEVTEPKRMKVTYPSKVTSLRVRAQ